MQCSASASSRKHGQDRCYPPALQSPRPPARPTTHPLCSQRRREALRRYRSSSSCKGPKDCSDGGLDTVPPSPTSDCRSGGAPPQQQQQQQQHTRVDVMDPALIGESSLASGLLPPAALKEGEGGSDEQGAGSGSKSIGRGLVRQMASDAWLDEVRARSLEGDGERAHAWGACCVAS